jgi:AraC-like DNA-binding protein
MNTDQELIQTKLHFDDFEDFAQAVLGWKLDFIQVNRGKFEADIHQIGTPNILITKAQFNRNLIQKGEPPSGMRTFGIMAANSSPSIWRKQQMNRDRLVIFPQGADLYSVSLPDFHIYTVSISEQLIAERVCREESGVLTTKLNQGGVLNCIPHKIRALSHFLDFVTSSAVTSPKSFSGQKVQNNLCEELIDQIIDVMSYGEYRRISTPFRNRASMMKKIESWVVDADYENLSVNKICHNLDINERTLRRIFQDWYGVSPKNFLLANRLHGARKELCQLDKTKVKIVDVANRWGFWHMGKFANYYYRQFAELPSETLRRMKQK